MGGGARHILLWYVWTRLVDGTWHKMDDIAKQLRLPRSMVKWAAKYLSDNGLAELDEDGEVRLNKTTKRFEEIVRSLPATRVAL